MAIHTSSHTNLKQGDTPSTRECGVSVSTASRFTSPSHRMDTVQPWGPFYYHGLTLIPVWITNYTHYNMCDESISPFLNFNGSKLQRFNRWSLGMDKWFHPTLYWACDYLSMLGLKLNHVSKGTTGDVPGQPSALVGSQQISAKLIPGGWCWIFPLL